MFFFSNLSKHQRRPKTSTSLCFTKEPRSSLAAVYPILGRGMSFRSTSSGTETPTTAGAEVPPVGYRFHPNDCELINKFLRPKNQGQDYHGTRIADVELCKIEPRDLPARSTIKSNDPVWYFYCRRELKFKNSRRSNRTTKEGYWKPDGKIRPIKDKLTKKMIGSKRTLVFHHGRPKGTRTKWVMHEYECSLDSGLSYQGDFVLCKLKNKSDEKDTKCDAYHLVESSLIFDSNVGSQPPKSTMPNSHTQNNASQMHHQNNGIGEVILSQLSSQTPKTTLQTSNIQNFDSVGAIMTSYQNNDITEVTLSQQSSQTPKTTLQTSSIQTFDSLTAINSSLCHCSNNDIYEVTPFDPETQANANSENYSGVSFGNSHCDASDGYSISPSQSAILSGTVANSTHNVADSLTSMAASYTDYGTQNQYENSDMLELDGLSASDLESKYEESEENFEFSSELWALLDTMLEQDRMMNSPLWMPFHSDEGPSYQLFPLECDSTLGSSPLSLNDSISYNNEVDC